MNEDSTRKLSLHHAPREADGPQDTDLVPTLDDGAGADEAQRDYANHQAEQHEAHHQVE